MKVYLIRHTAVDVPSGTCYGQTDVPLKSTFEAEAAQTLRNLNIVTPRTRIILDHLARTLWPATEEERRRKIAGTGFELAFDGMELR